MNHKLPITDNCHWFYFKPIFKQCNCQIFVFIVLQLSFLRKINLYIPPYSFGRLRISNKCDLLPSLEALNSIMTLVITDTNNYLTVRVITRADIVDMKKRN